MPLKCLLCYKKIQIIVGGYLHWIPNSNDPSMSRRRESEEEIELNRREKGARKKVNYLSERTKEEQRNRAE